MSECIDLRAIGSVNSRIRAIIDRSEKIYMIALNAMFMSRKATGGIGGFSSVTAQLRGFSRTLSKRMEDLRKRTAELSYITAETRKFQNFKRIVSQIDQRIGEKNIHRRIEQHAATAQEKLEYISEALLKELSRLERLIGVGQNLTVLAKVEATATGSISDMLMTISGDMDDAIEEIDQFITTSMRQLKAA